MKEIRIKDDRKKELELLAPAGSYESMTAAFNAGADAVYMGGSRFGARAYADSTREDSLKAAIDYAHIHGKKLFLTVNTLLKNEELERDLYGYLAPFYEAGLDAAIVQDLGVFSFIREEFPALPIHASTQMTITGPYGARAVKELGASRIVTARELSLEEIKEISETVEIEIEAFIHGAICYCYSGQCLLSSVIGGRSGNRGRCAQPCRLPYDVCQGKKTVTRKGENYVLSLKDMSTLDYLPDMIEAGVYSYKIEGRMKSPRYTAGVVSVYRNYMDMYREQGREGYAVSLEDRKMLYQLFDRGGYTSGYLFGKKGPEMIALHEKPAFRETDQALFERLDKDYVHGELKEKIKGKVIIDKDFPAKLELDAGGVQIHVTGDVVMEAQKQPLSEENLRRQMMKTGNTPFAFEELEVELSDSAFLPVGAQNNLRRKALACLEQAVLEKRRRVLPDRKEKEEDFFGDASNLMEKDRKKTDKRELKFNVYLESFDLLSVVVNNPYVSGVYLDSGYFSVDELKEAVNFGRKKGKDMFLAMPPVFKKKAREYFDREEEKLKHMEFDGILVKTIDELAYLSEKRYEVPLIADYSLYSYNQWAALWWKSAGIGRLTFPVELNFSELKVCGVADGELIAYGRQQVMVTEQCVQKTVLKCQHKPDMLKLKDRKQKEFLVKNCCRHCYNIIYNSTRLILLDCVKEIKKLNPESLRIHFTDEDGEQAKQVITLYGEVFHQDKKINKGEIPFSDYTRGHFKRGIE